MPRTVSHIVAFGAAAIWSLWCNSSVAQSALPDIEIFGAQWKTELGDDSADFEGQRVSVVLKPPAGTNFVGVDQVVETFREACGQIVARPADFSSSQHALDDLTFVHMAVEIGEQSLYPYLFSQRVANGACTGTISFIMPNLKEPFSKHDPNEELLSILNLWGLGAPEVSFTVGTKGRALEVDVPLLPNFERDPSSLNAMAICIHSLANIEASFKWLGVPTRAENYPSIKIDLVQAQLGGLTRVLGRAEFGVEDGKCVPLS